MYCVEFIFLEEGLECFGVKPSMFDLRGKMYWYDRREQPLKEEDFET